MSFLRNITYPIKLARGYFYDFNRYRKYDVDMHKVSSQERLRAALLKKSHSLEKGLSLSEPRVGFGSSHVLGLLRLVRKYINAFGYDPTLIMSLETLWAYYRWNYVQGNELIELYQTLQELYPKTETENDDIGRVVKIDREGILSKAKLDLKAFFETRYSIRSFSSEIVEMTIIEDAVRMAQKTPSVCNRQPWKVHVFSGEAKDKVIACQRGNKGFGHLANKVLVITSELQAFFSVNERNQYAIDGGMFSMSIVYALHSLGVGTCCLAWNVEPKDDIELRKIAKIPDSETIIMLIAVGHLPKQLQVVLANKKSLEQILVVLQCE